MALYIECSSDPVIGLANSFDKITQEYDPPSFWFRLEASCSAQIYKECTADIVGVWDEKGKWVNGFDSIKMFWISEPTNDIRKEKLKHYAPSLYPKKSDLLGLLHVKLPSKYRNSEFPVPDNNTPEHLVPEVKLNCSSQENKGASKRMTLPYGVYYIKVILMDMEGESVDHIFKVWALPDPKKCYIRHTFFYERWKISFCDSLGMGVDLPSGLPKYKKSRVKKNVENTEKEDTSSNAFDRNAYRENILDVMK